MHIFTSEIIPTHVCVKSLMHSLRAVLTSYSIFPLQSVRRVLPPLQMFKGAANPYPGSPQDKRELYSDRCYYSTSLSSCTGNI